MTASRGRDRGIVQPFASALCRRVEQSLRYSRQAALSFPAVFARLTGAQNANDRVEVRFDDDPIFRGSRSEIDWCVLAAIADAALGAVSDMHTGPGVRPATAHLALQVTGAPRHGQTTVVSSFLGFTSGSSARQSLVAATVKCGNVVAGHISAACVLLDLPSDRVRPRWPWLPEGFRLAPEEASALDVSERKALELCERAEAAATAQYPFIEHFWCGVPRSSGGEAHLQVPVARHLGNRIGHVQGGLLLGMAMKVADCAVSAHMRLSNISAYFVSPGTGPALTVISHVTHQGRRMATVRTRIVAANDKLVLEASSQHVAA